MTGGSRSAHTKSRNGCGRCKERRVRCSGQGPVCSHCARRGEWCDYLQTVVGQLRPGVADSSPSAQELHPAFSSSAATLQQLSPVLAAPGMLFCLFDSELNLWNAVIPQQISRHAFLQHMVISINALYLSGSIKQNSSGMAIASTPDVMEHAYDHLVQGSQRFRSAVPALTENNWFASMTFGIAMLVFHFQIARTSLEAETSFGSFLVLRQSSSMARAVGPWLRSSGLQSMIRRDDKPAPELDSRDEIAILGLHLLLTAKISDPAHWVPCQHAIDALHLWLLRTSGQPQTWRDFVDWPGLVSDEFLGLLQQQHNPVAIVVFVHWCAIMNNAPKRWFLDGWATSAAMRALVWLEEPWINDCSLDWAKLKLKLF